MHVKKRTPRKNKNRTPRQYKKRRTPRNKNRGGGNNNKKNVKTGGDKKLVDEIILKIKAQKDLISSINTIILSTTGEYEIK